MNNQIAVSLNLGQSPTNPTQPPFRAITDFADMDEESFLRELTKNGDSEEKVKKMYQDSFGGIDKFLEIARQQKRQMDEYMRTHGPPVTLGRKPRDGEKVQYASLNEQCAVRIFGFEELAPFRVFCFDFVDVESNRTIPKPSDIRIFGEADPRIGIPEEAEVFSIVESIRRAIGGNAPLVSQAAGTQNGLDANSETETYTSVEGALIRFEQGNNPPVRLRVPIHGRQGI